jgi:uncharacterized pyridoxamine 5'-phosphate oxidase family protein
MSYLERLIERATDTNLDLENNRIGNYSITPQHGNVYVYIIYKHNTKPHYSNTKKRYNNVHVCTITIDFSTVEVEVNADYLTSKDISNIQDAVNHAYGYGNMPKDINIKNI